MDATKPKGRGTKNVVRAAHALLSTNQPGPVQVKKEKQI